MAAACFVQADAGNLVMLRARLQYLGYSTEKLEDLQRNARVRRIIPDPVTLSNAVTQVMLDYQCITDPISHIPLLNKAARQQFRCNLKAVQDDLLSGELAEISSCAFES